MFDPYSGPSKAFVDGLFKPDYWRALAPDLTISEGKKTAALDFRPHTMDASRDKLVKEGYLHFQSPGTKAPFRALQNITQKLVDMGLPPVFAFVYDEVWAIGAQLDTLMQKLAGESYLMLPDFWLWHVPPGSAGWSVHRDKDADSLLMDGTPKWISVWVPLTPATPTNSCMYVLPANRDPLYGKFGAMDHTNLRGDISDIKALPAEPGDILLWSQHLLHWGSRSEAGHALPPRMSIGLEYQRADVPARDKPLLKPTETPAFEQRLALIAKQIWYYRDALGDDPALFQVSKAIHKAFGRSLRPLHQKPSKAPNLLDRFTRRTVKAR